jgi:hypothetical protein
MALEAKQSKGTMKIREDAFKVLRYRARNLDQSIEECGVDIAYIIKYFMRDDEISVFKKSGRNSGVYWCFLY